MPRVSKISWERTDLRKRRMPRKVPCSEPPKPANNSPVRVLHNRSAWTRAPVRSRPSVPAIRWDKAVPGPLGSLLTSRAKGSSTCTGTRMGAVSHSADKKMAEKGLLVKLITDLMSSIPQLSTLTARAPEHFNKTMRGAVMVLSNWSQEALLTPIQKWFWIRRLIAHKQLFN